MTWSWPISPLASWRTSAPTSCAKARRACASCSATGNRLEKKLALLDKLVANAAEDIGLKEKLYEENQIDHTDLLAAMTSQERYLSNREELLAQMEMLKVNLDTLIGKCEEE